MHCKTIRGRRHDISNLFTASLQINMSMYTCSDETFTKNYRKYVKHMFVRIKFNLILIHELTDESNCRASLFVFFLRL